MKVVLAGAYGNLGAEIFKALLKAGHEVVAADILSVRRHGHSVEPVATVRFNVFLGIVCAGYFAKGCVTD